MLKTRRDKKDDDLLHIVRHYYIPDGRSSAAEDSKVGHH